MKISGQSEKRVRFAEFELNLDTRELQANGRRLILQEQPFQILATLLERPGHLVNRDELRHRLWSSDTFVDFERGLNKAVNRLREVLDDSVNQPRFIETLPRRGYRFIATLEPSFHSGLPEMGLSRVESPIKRERLPWSREAKLSAMSLAVIAAILVGWMLGRRN